MEKMKRPFIRFLLIDEQLRNRKPPYSRYGVLTCQTNDLSTKSFSKDDLIFAKECLKTVLIDFRSIIPADYYTFGGSSSKYHKDLDIIIKTKNEFTLFDKCNLFDQLYTEFVNFCEFIELDIYIHSETEFDFLEEIGFLSNLQLIK